MSDNPALGGIRLVFGGNVLGWTADRDASFRVLDAFYEAGGRMIDSAENYSSWVEGNKGGESETILGEWIEARGVRSDVLIATKTGSGGTPGALRPERVHAAMEASLERLRTDYVDLYYVHRDNDDVPQDEVVACYDGLVRTGKTRAVGASNFTPARLASALDIAERTGATGFSVLQNHYNLVERQEFEGAMQSLCIERGVAMLPYFSLASGYLTGKYRTAGDVAGDRGKFVGHLLEKGAPVLAVMDDIAAETGASHVSIALAWLSAQPGVHAPIASARNVEQLEGLLAHLTLELDANQLQRLTDAGTGL